MEATIDNLTIQITTSANTAVTVIDRLASSLSGLGTTSRKVARDVGKLSDKLEEGAKESEAHAKASESGAEHVRLFGDKLKGVIGELGKFSNKLSGATSSFIGFGKSFAKISFKGIKAALYDLPNYFGGKLVGSVMDATSKMTQFFNSLKRIALYRLIRTAIKEITKGLSEGIKNLYHWSELFGGTFYKRMNQLATATNYLKNSFAAMVSPLIESLAPAIDFIIDKFVDMFNIVNQIFARLTGKTTYTAAKKVATVWDEETKKATKSAKELKRTILGFDEINKLVDNNSGNGSSGKSATDYSNMFETRTISSWISDMVKSGDFSLLGRTIADKINGALANINWNSIRTKAFYITDAITSLLNGFIQKIDPRTLGKALGEAVNTAVSTIDRFWSKVSWDVAGQKLRTAITEFFATVNFEKAADALTGKFKSLTTLISNALPQSPAEWAFIGHKISTFINRAIQNISESDIGSIIGNLISGALTTVTILAEEGTLTKIANGIKKAIQDACKKITPEQVQRFVSSVLKDVLHAVGVLFSIDIGFGGATIDAGFALAFGLMATKLLKGAFGKVFGSASASGLGKNIAFAAGITLALDAVITLADLVNGIISGGGVDWSKAAKFLRTAALSTGMFLLAKGHVAAGLVALGIGIVIEPLINTVKEIALGDVSLSEIKNSFVDGIYAFVDSLLAPLGFDVVYNDSGVDMKIPFDLELSPQSKVSYKNDTPIGHVGDFLNVTSGAPSTNANISVGVDYVANGNPSYKNKTLNNYITKLVSSAMPKVKSTVNSVAGIAMEIKNNKLTPITEDTNTTNTVNAAAGNNMTGGGFRQWLSAVVADTSTTNTVAAKTGMGMHRRVYGGMEPDVYNTETTNTVTLRKGWSGSATSALGINGLTSTVAVELWTGWWARGWSVLKWLGMDNLTATINVVTSVSNAVLSAFGRNKARGGIYSNGSWSDIPQYAGGTTNAHGSLFLAGEAGPEIVGHIGGRTEVLNKSQIASAMYQAVNSAMRGVTLDANFNGGNSDGMVEMIEYLRQDGDAMRQQNDLLRQQNELLRQISEKEFTTEVTSYDINRSQQRANRRAGRTVVALG